ncbi:MAG: hypothetical protein COA96_04565 [SAR86 cluster bacterium]|uniref:Thioredoxin domain-containing protein n=1 Tax=SAR86 cluster bacterium TaxID=2030880 RepID=A0A2A5B5S7_9GAMM|nr:MAG: hypothetical protein COA96_04565 [SAR86 cluster bacterium]
MILDRDAFTIEYDAARTTLDQMYVAIESLGYTPRLAIEDFDIDSMDEVLGEIPEPILAGVSSARQMGRYVFVDFYAEWCIACKALEEITLESFEVQSALDEFVVIKVDTDAYPESAVYFGVVGMPTLLILNSDGKELFRSVGPISADKLSRVLIDSQVQ